MARCRQLPLTKSRKYTPLHQKRAQDNKLRHLFIYLLLGCNCTSRYSYGDASANEQADAATAGGCTAEPCRDIAPCGRFTLPHCSFSTFCVCPQCYLNARWELVIGVPGITHSSLGFVAALAWAFAKFTLPSWHGWDPCLAKSPPANESSMLETYERIVCDPSLYQLRDLARQAALVKDGWCFPQDRLDLRDNGSLSWL